MIILLLQAALAAEFRPVREGDTVESIAADLGDPSLVDALRTLNDLGTSGQPTVGTLLRLPELAGHIAQQAFVITERGGVQLTESTGAVRPLAALTPIPTDGMVCTAPDGGATLRIASTCDDSGDKADDIVLAANTCLTVRSAHATQQGRATVVNVTKGSIAVLAKKDVEGHVTVVTPTGLTSGREGGYRITIEDSASRTETVAGTATVAGSGAQVELVDGQGSRVRKGEAPTPPIDLLRMGPLTHPADGAELRRPVFGWTSVEGAFGYSVDMASTAAFQEVLFQERTSETSLQPAVLLLPYRSLDGMDWRVAAFDRFGFLGVPSPPRRVTFPAGLR